MTTFPLLKRMNHRVSVAISGSCKLKRVSAELISSDCLKSTKGFTWDVTDYHTNLWWLFLVAPTFSFKMQFFSQSNAKMVP